MISKSLLGKVKGRAIYTFKLENSSGAFVEVLNYGAIIKSICVFDKHGTLGNVVAGFDALDGYTDDTNYIGATIGRFSNRIAKAGFQMDGKQYRLDKNDGENNLHGGNSGFHQQVFSHEIQQDVLRLSLKSKDGEGGFPGTVKLEMFIQWKENNRLHIDFKATSDQKTPLTLTHHSYFNLSGFKRNIEHHELTMNSERYLETDAAYLPTGKILTVSIPWKKENSIGKLLEERGEGFNSYYIFAEKDNGKAQCMATCKASGRRLSLFTSYPGVEFYTADFLETKSSESHGKRYQPFDAFCLEPQHFLDNMNHKHFPKSLVFPTKPYHHWIVYEFGLVD